MPRASGFFQTDPHPTPFFERAPAALSHNGKNRGSVPLRDGQAAAGRPHDRPAAAMRRGNTSAGRRAGSFAVLAENLHPRARLRPSTFYADASLRRRQDAAIPRRPRTRNRLAACAFPFPARRTCVRPLPIHPRVRSAAGTSPVDFAPAPRRSPLFPAVSPARHPFRIA